jgi:acetyl esterase/lipase
LEIIEIKAASCLDGQSPKPAAAYRVRIAEKVRGAGGEVELEEWPRMPHGWQHYARIIPEGRRATERIGVFVQTRLN